MRAVIPAAGFGTRLKPHTHSLPKVMLNVGGKPIIGHIVDKLIQEGINKATFIIGYMGEKIIDYINSEYPLIDARFVEQEELLGLGHAIYVALKDESDKEIFIILGDTIFDFDLKKGFEKNATALGVKQVEDPSRFGVAVCENDTIIKLIEKPQTPISKLALVGLYYIKNTTLLKECLTELIEKNIRTRGEYQLTDALQLMIDKGEVIKTFDVEGWYDCGKPETLLETNRFLLSKNGTHKKFDNVVVIEPVYIDEKAEIINSVIGPFATISKGCKITDSIIRNSIISEGALIDKSMLENSIIGSNAIVKGNFKRLNTGDSSEIEYY
ncbi:sugar phosphate nucleotidyltransferase [Melioribacter sp. OK-6-Me]|uniref:sugar phosphate nucleotidyltransferase n=1 Tax=unclassified Melioribacter TaxID=2627329 RepID=UPI003EDAEC93